MCHFSHYCNISISTQQQHVDIYPLHHELDAGEFYREVIVNKHSDLLPVLSYFLSILQRLWHYWLSAFGRWCVDPVNNSVRLEVYDNIATRLHLCLWELCVCVSREETIGECDVCILVAFVQNPDVGAEVWACVFMFKKHVKQPQCEVLFLRFTASFFVTNCFVAPSLHLPSSLLDHRCCLSLVDPEKRGQIWS